jgi:GNAT superfamily N-acetyltransferase
VSVSLLHDKDEIESFLRHNTPLHLYELGDLDEFFWPYTSWYALQETGQIRALALLYCNLEFPTLLAITDDLDAERQLLSASLPLLPRRMYAHLSGDLARMFDGTYNMDSHGLHFKMALQDLSRLARVDSTQVIPLSSRDAFALNALYQISYPGNWFDPRMLQTGLYYGIQRAGKLVSVAGVHVYSPRYRVGVLGNVTTHPDYRNQGLGKAVCARLCIELLKTVDDIGLNVMADNASAIAAYKRLGFEIVGEYEEGLLVSR